MSKIYDVAILGAGPAGLAAGFHAGRSRLDTVIVEKGQDGGQIAITDEIENYPGQSLDKESGPTLIARMTAQAQKFGAERVRDVIQSVELEGDVKKLTGSQGEYFGRTVILATGAFPRPWLQNEGKFMGKGISFCATCDAAFFEDFEVYVVGGGDAAVEEAMYLSKFARKVTIIHRRNELRAAKSHSGARFQKPQASLYVGHGGGRAGRRALF